MNKLQSRAMRADVGRRISAVVLAAAVCAFAGQAARSAVIINTFPMWNGSNFIFPFGETNTSVYGQTFKAPAVDNRLTNFTFRINDLQDPDIVTFDAYVYAWDGTKAIGPALFTAGPFSTNNNGGAGGFQIFSINTPNIPLVSGAQYVAFFSAANRFNGSQGTSNWAYLGSDIVNGVNGYADGAFVYLNCGSSFGQITTNTWETPTGYGGQVTHDLAFSMTFIPEPATAGLLAAGCLLGACNRSSRNRRG